MSNNIKKGIVIVIIGLMCLMIFFGFKPDIPPKITEEPKLGMTAYPTVNSYCYYKTITINHLKVASSTSATPETYINFPILVSLTDANLTSTSTGGRVYNTYGHDIQFATSTASGTTLKPREIELYTSTTGRLESWVRLDSISTTTDTVLYMYYNNTSEASTSPSLIDPFVWDVNYKGVWHLGNNLTLTDSTGVYDLTNNGGTNNNAGQIDGAISFDGASHYASNDSGPTLTGLHTLSVWAKRTNRNNRDPIVSQGVANSGWAFLFEDDAHGNYIQYNNYSGGSNSLVGYTDSNWHYVTFTVDTSIVTGALYVDGVLQWTGYQNYAPSSGALYVGNGILWSWYLTGSADEFRMSNKVRSADWIKTEYNNQSATSTFYTIGSETASGFCGEGVVPTRESVWDDE